MGGRGGDRRRTPGEGWLGGSPLLQSDQGTPHEHVPHALRLQLARCWPA